MSNELVKESKASKGLWKNAGIFVTMLSFLILIAIMFAAAYQVVTINTNLAQLAAAADKKAAYAIDAVKVMQANNEAQLAAMQAQENKLSGLLQTNAQDLQILQANFLVRSAQAVLSLEGNIELALRLLQSAAQELSQIKGDELQPLKQALTSDIEALQHVPVVDTENIYLRLVAIDEQIDHLTLESVNALPEKTAVKKAESLSWWKQGLHSAWQALQQVVIVKKIQPSTLPFVPPDQQIYFYQNLKLQLSQAEWALLRGKTAIYQLSLKQAFDWIKQYAKQNDAVTEQVLTELTALQQIDIHPAAPTIDHTWQSFESYLGTK